MQEEHEEVESSANLNIQSQVPHIHCVHEEHSSDLSLLDDPPVDETPAEKSSEYTPDDCSTWNGKKIWLNVSIAPNLPPNELTYFLLYLMQGWGRGRRWKRTMMMKRCPKMPDEMRW